MRFKHIIIISIGSILLLVLTFAFSVFAGSLTLLLLLGVLALQRKRAGACSYNVAADYVYNFENTNARIESIEVKDNYVSLPSSGKGNHTVFLKLHVNASFWGSIFHPAVRIVSGEDHEVQYFELGAVGIRYINVSSFVGSVANEVQVSGRYLNYDPLSVELLQFENVIPENPKVLVIAPHPDDAEIAAFGFYSDFKDTHILTLTAGDEGIYNYDKVYGNEAEHYVRKGELRTWNSITVPMICGIPPEQSVNLGFFDRTMKAMFQDKDAEVCGTYTKIEDITTFRRQNVSTLASKLDGTSTWNSLVQNLTRLLKEIQPDIIITPHPILDSECDHRFSSIAVFEAIRNTGMREGSLFMYANHQRYNELVPYGPIGGTVTLPPVFSKKIRFTSIYSCPLSKEKQQNKMLSMEAMNDLRPNTNRYMSSRTTLAAVKAPLKSCLGFDDSYFRRAVRGNELFFVAEVSDLYDETKLSRLTGLPHHAIR